MAVNIHHLITAISPDTFCKARKREEVKRVAKEKGYLEAAKIITPEDIVESDWMDISDQERGGKGAFWGTARANPQERHLLIYEVSTGALEPIYFWILEFLRRRYGKVEKLIDNFIAAPGSGYFSEMGAKSTRMQEEGMKMLGAANTVIKSILNILYDLKEFKIRLSTYKDYHSENKQTKNAAMLSLKQIWMDSVDAKRANSSIKGLAQQFDYVTVIDAFMAANSLDDVTKKPEDGGIDLNERVRRILQQRISEFFKWVTESEKELTKRFLIEKNYLKSQMASLELYARWAKPYLTWARQLEQNANPDADLIISFNTNVLELTIMAIGRYDPRGDIMFDYGFKSEMPEVITKLIKEDKVRQYLPILILEYRYVSIPEKSGPQGGYGFKGRANLMFTSYALNQDEIAVLRREVAKDDFGDVYGMINDATTDTIKLIQKDIDEFLKDSSEPGDEIENKESSKEDTNPFASLFGFISPVKPKAKIKKEDIKFVEPDNHFEKAMRNMAVIESRKECRRIWSSFKKAYNMPSY